MLETVLTAMFQAGYHMPPPGEQQAEAAGSSSSLTVAVAQPVSDSLTLTSWGTALQAAF